MPATGLSGVRGPRITMKHIPVLLNEVIEILRPHSGGRYIDGTLGDGGHSYALLEASNPDGRLLGLDQDQSQIAVASARLEQFRSRVVLVCTPYSRMKEVASAHGFAQVDGILLDLGVSSRQLDTSEYGLTFTDDAPLDMRLSHERQNTAADLLNRANEQTIADTLYYYGDRHNSRTLARKIVHYRKKQVFQVARDVKEALNLWRPADLAPIFQALRIWVNEEYAQIEAVLPQAVELLAPGGRIAVISFHSGEDRIVKRFMQSHRELLEVSKKIIQPTFEEVKRNPRARSAKLRWAEKKVQEGTA